MNRWPHFVVRLCFAAQFLFALVGCEPRQQLGGSGVTPEDFVAAVSAHDAVDSPEAKRPATADQAALRSVEDSAYGSNSSSAASEISWPTLFGPHRTSVSGNKVNATWLDNGPELIWEAESGTGYGSPVTADQRVVYSFRKSDKEWVQCRSIDSGALLWEQSFSTDVVCDFDYSDGPYSTPIIDVPTRRVFDVGGGGRFSCLDFDTGRVIWSRDLHNEYGVDPDIFPVGATPILDREHSVDEANGMGQLIFNLGAVQRDAGILALSVDDGRTIWTATDHGPAYATPMIATIHSMRFVFVLTDEGLVSLDPDSGQVDWLYEFRRKGDLVRNATSPMVFGDKVLAISSGLGAVCLRITPQRSYEIEWRNRRSIDSQYNTVILGDQHVYSFTSSRQGGAEFRCVDLRSGDVAWRYPSPLKRGMALATQDAIILLGEHGHLAALEFTSHDARELSFTPQPIMQDPCYCSPAIYGEKLVLKDESRVAVFDLSNGP